jgi:hypothetical protein
VEGVKFDNLRFQIRDSHTGSGAWKFLIIHWKSMGKVGYYGISVLSFKGIARSVRPFSPPGFEILPLPAACLTACPPSPPYEQTCHRDCDSGRRCAGAFALQGRAPRAKGGFGAGADRRPGQPSGSGSGACSRALALKKAPEKVRPGAGLRRAFSGNSGPPGKFLKSAAIFREQNPLSRVLRIGYPPPPPPSINTSMKLVLSSLAALFLSPLAFAGDCDKCKDKEKEDPAVALVGDCDKCKEKDKEDPALALAGDCDKCKEKDKEDPALALAGDCDKCKEKDKEDPALAGDCDKCKEKDKEDPALAGDCDKCKEKDKEDPALIAGDCDKCKEKDKEDPALA